MHFHFGWKVYLILSLGSGSVNLIPMDKTQSTPLGKDWVHCHPWTPGGFSNKYWQINLILSMRSVVSYVLMVSWFYLAVIKQKISVRFVEIDTHHQGTDGDTKTDEFSEKFQTAFDPPPPHFRKIILRISRQNCDKVRMFIMAGLLCIIWSYFPWDACSTTVQGGNWLKTYPKKTILYHFHAEKALFKVQNLQYNFLD